MNFAWRKSVKDVRNFLAHVGNGHVTKSDFQTHWLSLEIATYGFAEELGNKCLKMFKKDVSHIKSSSIEGLKITLKETRDQLCKTLYHLNGFKPLCTDVAESKTILQSMQTQQSEQNMKVDNKLEEMNSLLLGIIANQRIDKLKSSVSVYDSEESIRTDEIKSTSSSSVSLQCKITSSILDEDKALKQITKDKNEKDEKQFEVKSAEKKCLLLHLQSSRGIFRSVESLWYAINSLLKRIVKAGEIDTSVENTMNIKLALTSPVTDEERNVIRAMLSKYGDLNEKYIVNQSQTSDEVDLAIKTKYVLKTEGGITPSFFKVQTKVADRTDSTSFRRVKMETDEEKYDEIFVDVDNLKCLLKIKGLPNDLYQTELEERPPDVKDTQLLYVEWTLSCPSEWNVELISSNIQDNLYSFHDDFSIDYVYDDTSSILIIHTTTQRVVFRSYSSIEVAVKNLIGKIMNVSNIKSTEPDELSASLLIMNKPEKEEEFQTKFIKKGKKDEFIFGFKDNIVKCEHCTRSFSCKNCTSKIDHIRRLDLALKMKDQTIRRLEMALTKREKEMVEGDESDYKSYFSEEPDEDTTKTPEIEITGEPEHKKRKTAITSDIEKSKDNQPEDADKSLNHIKVDMKQALLKLGEIPLLDYYIDIYKNYLKNLWAKWGRRDVKPKNEHAIQVRLVMEKKERTALIAKLKDVIHNQDVFKTTDESYSTDRRFLDVDENPAIKCTYCHTKEAYQIVCYCRDCKIFICYNCLIEHRMKNKKHNCIYQSKILREYKLANSWRPSTYSKIFDLKCMAGDIVAILKIDELCIYNFAGALINSVSISPFEVWNSQIACINNYQIAVTEPREGRIKIFTIVAPNTITAVGTPAGTIMTGGITCRMDMLYVAFTDAIRLMDLSGQIQRVVNIPRVKLLHSMNNDKMLCVYSKDDLDKTLSCLDFTNDSFNDFERFPFHVDDVSTDEVGNIIFLENGVIWQADSDGNNIRIIMSNERQNAYKKITYNKDSKCLFTYQDGYNGSNTFKVNRKLE